MQKVVIELKVLHKGLDQTMARGLDQTRDYMDLCGTNEGHLVLFNRDTKIPWEEKIFRRSEECRGMEINVWGM